MARQGGLLDTVDETKKGSRELELTSTFVPRPLKRGGGVNGFCFFGRVGMNSRLRTDGTGLGGVTSVVEPRVNISSHG